MPQRPTPLSKIAYLCPMTPPIPRRHHNIVMAARIWNLDDRLRTSRRIWPGKADRVCPVPKLHSQKLLVGGVSESLRHPNSPDFVVGGSFEKPEPATHSGSSVGLRSVAPRNLCARCQRDRAGHACGADPHARLYVR